MAGRATLCVDVALEITVTLGVVGGTPTVAFAVMVAHRLLSSAMSSNDDSKWLDHSLMLSFYYLRGLPLRWFTAAYHDGRHGRTMIICDA